MNANSLLSRQRNAGLGLSIGLCAVVAATWLTGVRPSGADQNRTAQPADGATMFRYRAAIPAGTYRAFIASPAPTGNVERGSAVRFVIRTMSAANEVEDFIFHVPAGETESITFPVALRLTTDSILYASGSVSFAAWGLTDQGLVRVEEVTRDPREDANARERERDFEAFLRERERNRVR